MLKGIITVLVSIILVSGISYAAHNYFERTILPEEQSIKDATSLLKAIEQATGIDFSEIKEAEIKWVVEVNPKVQEVNIEGKGFKAERISMEQYIKIESFLESKGFKKDLYNMADGTVSGLEGYKKDKIACTVTAGATGYKEATGQWIPPEPNMVDVEVRCGEIDSGEQKIETETGRTFSMTQEANPTTGFQWELDFDSSYVQLIDREYVSGSKEPMPGTGGYETFNFLALKPGTTEIRFSYLRSWETEEPAKLVIYEITIK